MQVGENMPLHSRAWFSHKHLEFALKFLLRRP